MDTFEGVSLSCTCTLETLDNAGTVLRKKMVRKGVLTLGRNEFGDVVVKITSPQGSQGLLILITHNYFVNTI